MTKNNSINTGTPGVVQSIVKYTMLLIGDGGTGMSGYDVDIISSTNAIPQQTQGTEILSIAITPLFATSMIVVEYSGNNHMDDTPNMFAIAALFKDSGANAISVSSALVGYSHMTSLIYTEPAISTATRTYKLHMGRSIGAAVLDTNDKLGNKSINTLAVYEIGI